MLARYSYDAWGVCTITSDSSDCDIATINPFRYRGYYYDSEIGIYYLQSRYYNPVLGRFINGDEATYLGSSGTGLGYNLFAYCENNVVNLNDPAGRYAGVLVLNSSMAASLSNALPGIMAGIGTSMAGIKAAIATSWYIPVCIAAAAIAIVGIAYVVNRVYSSIPALKQSPTYQAQPHSIECGWFIFICHSA